ncbi:MAG: hypothetical protein ACK4GQ_06120, partial [Candidatus Hadarchaeales archaeon]
VETWSATAQTSAWWQLAEMWSATIATSTAWSAAETWQSAISASATWWNVESWYSTVTAVGAWRLAETWTANITATIPAPTLVSPPNGASLSDNTPLLDWDNSLPADNFELQVDNDPDFSSPIYYKIGILTSQHELENQLAPDNYYWRVRMFRNNENGPWSENWKFIIGLLPPGAPQLYKPDNNDNVRRTVRFEWTIGSGADNHRIEIDNDDDPTNGLYENVTLGAFDNTYTTTLYQYTTYVWRVVAVNASGENSSENWYFRVYADWDLVEEWSGAIITVGGWVIAESWNATLNSVPTGWQVVESWSATVSTPLPQWYLAESWTATINTGSIWSIAESWSGVIAAPGGWQSVEIWTAAVIGEAGWGHVETWSATAQTSAWWQLAEMWSVTIA